MDPILQFYHETRERFPALVAETDRKHQATCGVDDIYPYLWFEALANVLNATMRKGTGLDVAGKVFDDMRHRFATGGAEVRNCIDVAFVENLFDSVRPDDAQAYWARLPDLLKHLYLGFHARPPCRSG